MAGKLADKGRDAGRSEYFKGCECTKGLEFWKLGWKGAKTEAMTFQVVFLNCSLFVIGE